MKYDDEYLRELIHNSISYIPEHLRKKLLVEFLAVFYCEMEKMVDDSVIKRLLSGELEKKVNSAVEEKLFDMDLTSGFYDDK